MTPTTLTACFGPEIARNFGLGNYWSRYTGTDQDGDGIGDSPHKIFGELWETDSNPAMDPYHPKAEIEWDHCAFEES